MFEDVRTVRDDRAPPAQGWAYCLLCILTGIVLYVLILVFFPTDWARRRVERRLTLATNQTVHVGGLRLAVPSGVVLSDVQISKSQSGENPWVKLDQARIDLCLLDLLRGPMQPRRIEVDGLSIKLERGADGECPSTELLQGPPPTQPKSVRESYAAFEHRDRQVVFVVRNASIESHDVPTDTHINVRGLSGHGFWSREHIEIQELAGELNEGTIRIAARLDRDGAVPRFEVLMRARGVALDAGLASLRYLAPIVPKAHDGLSSQSKIDLSLDLHGAGANCARRSAPSQAMGRSRSTPSRSRIRRSLESWSNWTSCRITESLGRSKARSSWPGAPC